MSFKINTVLLFCTLVFCLPATAQDSDVKEKLAAVNAQIDATSKENVELKERLAEIQNQIDELKRESEEKEDELNALRQKAGDSE